MGMETAGGMKTKVIGHKMAISTENGQTSAACADNQPRVLIQIREGERAVTGNMNLLGMGTLMSVASASRCMETAGGMMEFSPDDDIEVSNTFVHFRDRTQKSKRRSRSAPPSLGRSHQLMAKRPSGPYMTPGLLRTCLDSLRTFSTSLRPSFGHELQRVGNRQKTCSVSAPSAAALMAHSRIFHARAMDPALAVPRVRPVRCLRRLSCKVPAEDFNEVLKEHYDLMGCAWPPKKCDTCKAQKMTLAQQGSVHRTVDSKADSWAVFAAEPRSGLIDFMKRLRLGNGVCSRRSCEVPAEELYEVFKEDYDLMDCTWPPKKNDASTAQQMTFVQQGSVHRTVDSKADPWAALAAEPRSVLIDFMKRLRLDDGVGWQAEPRDSTPMPWLGSSAFLLHRNTGEDECFWKSLSQCTGLTVRSLRDLAAARAVHSPECTPEDCKRFATNGEWVSGADIRKLAKLFRDIVPRGFFVFMTEHHVVLHFDSGLEVCSGQSVWMQYSPGHFEWVEEARLSRGNETSVLRLHPSTQVEAHTCDVYGGSAPSRDPHFNELDDLTLRIIMGLVLEVGDVACLAAVCRRLSMSLLSFECWRGNCSVPPCCHCLELCFSRVFRSSLSWRTHPENSLILGSRRSLLLGMSSDELRSTDGLNEYMQAWVFQMPALHLTSIRVQIPFEDDDEESCVTFGLSTSSDPHLVGMCHWAGNDVPQTMGMMQVGFEFVGAASAEGEEAFDGEHPLLAVSMNGVRQVVDEGTEPAQFRYGAVVTLCTSPSEASIFLDGLWMGGVDSNRLGELARFPFSSPLFAYCIITGCDLLTDHSFVSGVSLSIAGTSVVGPRCWYNQHLVSLLGHRIYGGGFRRCSDMSSNSSEAETGLGHDAEMHTVVVSQRPRSARLPLILETVMKLAACWTIAVGPAVATWVITAYLPGRSPVVLRARVILDQRYCCLQMLRSIQGGSLHASSSASKPGGHEVQAVLGRVGPGPKICPVAKDCALASKKHYHCSCGTPGWLSLTKAQRHAAFAAQKECRDLSVLQSAAASLRRRCSLKPIAVPLVEVDSSSTVPCMVQRFALETKLKSDLPLERLLRGTVFHHIPSVCTEAKDESRASFFQRKVTLGWHVRFATAQSRCKYGRICDVPGASGVSCNMFAPTSVAGVEDAFLLQRVVVQVNYEDIECTGFLVRYDHRRKIYTPLGPLDELATAGTAGDVKLDRICDKLRALPSDPNAPSIERFVGCPWRVLVVTPLEGMESHVQSGHQVSLSTSRSTLLWVLDEPVPRPWISQHFVCHTCRTAPMRPSLADVQKCFADVKLCKTGRTWYTMSFLQALSSHFVLHPIKSEMRLWLAERWCQAEFSHRRTQPSFFAQSDCELAEQSDTLWLLGALRSSDVLLNLVKAFVENFLGLVAQAIEQDLWLHNSARVGVDVCVKLGKMFAYRPAKARRFVRLFTGVIIHTGTDGALLSPPLPVLRESGHAYERELTWHLYNKRPSARAEGRLRDGQPCLVTVDHPSFLPGLVRGVTNVYADLMYPLDYTPPPASEVLADRSYECGTCFALDVNHRNFSFAKHASSKHPDYELALRVHKIMISHWSLPSDDPVHAREGSEGRWAVWPDHPHFLTGCVGLLETDDALGCSQCQRPASRVCDRCSARVCIGCFSSSRSLPQQKKIDYNFHESTAALVKDMVSSGIARMKATLTHVVRGGHATWTVAHAAAVCLFLERADIVEHPFWLRIFTTLPPTSFVCLLQDALLLPRSGRILPVVSTDSAWCEEVDKFAKFWDSPLSTRGPATWFTKARGDVTGEECRQGTSASPAPGLMTDLVRRHCKNLKSRAFLQGARAWNHANAMARQSGCVLPSGTTDVDAVCAHLQVILANRQRHVVSVGLGKLLLLIAFLRVVTSKAFSGRAPLICHRNPGIALVIAEASAFLRTEPDSCDLLHDWWMKLGVQPPIQHQASGKKRRRSAVRQLEPALKRRLRTSLHSCVPVADAESDWETAYGEQASQRPSAPSIHAGVRMVANLRTGIVHCLRLDGTSYCIWRVPPDGRDMADKLVAPQSVRCPACFAKLEREIRGGAAVAAGAGGATFAQRGEPLISPDPVTESLVSVRAAVAPLVGELSEGWCNFFAVPACRGILVHEDALLHLDTVEKLQKDVTAHVQEVLDACGKLDLKECMNKAKAVDPRSCFHKVDFEAFTHIARIYGTDVHVASALDASNIAFFAGEKILRVCDEKLDAKFLIHSHIIIRSGASKSPLFVFYLNNVLQRDCLTASLDATMKQRSNFLISTEVNFEGLVRKAAKSKGGLRIIVDEIDTVLNEVGRNDRSKLQQSHLINVCDCSMPEIGKEMAERDKVTAAPKVCKT
jgi:hypothetical protein